MSSSPAASAACIRSEVSSVSATSSSGWASWKSARKAAMSKAWPAAPETSPSVTRPRSSPVYASTVCRTASAAARAARAYGRTARPTSVGVTDRPERSSRGCPSSFSNWRIWALRPGWARCSRAAARVKPPSSTTVTK